MENDKFAKEIERLIKEEQQFKEDSKTMSQEELNSKYPDQDFSAIQQFKELSFLSFAEKTLMSKSSLEKMYREAVIELMLNPEELQNAKKEVETLQKNEAENTFDVQKKLQLLKSKLHFYLLSQAKENVPVSQILQFFGVSEAEVEHTQKYRDVYLLKYEQFPVSKHLTSHWAIKVGNNLYHISYSSEMKRTQFKVNPYNPKSERQIYFKVVGQTLLTDSEIVRALEILANNHEYSSATNNCQLFVNQALALILIRPYQDDTHTLNTLYTASIILTALFVAGLTYKIFLK